MALERFTAPTLPSSPRQKGGTMQRCTSAARSVSCMEVPAPAPFPLPCCDGRVVLLLYGRHRPSLVKGKRGVQRTSFVLSVSQLLHTACPVLGWYFAAAQVAQLSGEKESQEWRGGGIVTEMRVNM